MGHERSRLLPPPTHMIPLTTTGTWEAPWEEAHLGWCQVKLDHCFIKLVHNSVLGIPLKKAEAKYLI